MGALIFLGSVLLLILWGFIASEFRHIAASKGYDEAKYFWWSFFFGIAGWLMVAALPDRNSPYNTTTRTDPDYSVLLSKKSSSDPDVSTANPSETSSLKVNTAEDGEIHFSSRPQGMLICPSCGRRQSGGRDYCFHCGAFFVFDDEENSESSDTIE